MKYEELVHQAFQARKHAYTPYSHFQVGAALLCDDGKVFEGANIENSAYPVCLCAERTALAAAVYAGERDFTAIAVVGGQEDALEFGFCSPCGVCRQALNEFCDPDHFHVILARSDTDYKVYTLRELLPLGFTAKDMAV